MTNTRIPDLNDLARYRQPIAELTELIRRGDPRATDRARAVLDELDLIAARVDAAFHDAGGSHDESPGGDLVYQLASDRELSSVLDELDERGATPGPSRERARTRSCGRRR